MKTEHDFGRVHGGAVLEHEFFITNDGAEPLEILQAKATCGCVEIEAWPSTIAPGETGIIPIKFHSGSYRGLVVESITLTPANTNQPPRVLTLKAEIWRPIDVQPAAAVFEFFPDEPAATNFHIRIVNFLEEPVRLSPPESSHPNLAAELSAVIPGREFALTVRTIPPLKTANIVGRILLKTSADSMPQIEVPVHALAPAVVSLLPRTIVLPGKKSLAPISRSIAIRNHGPNRLTLDPPSVNLDGVEVSLTESAPGRRFLLTLTVPSGFELPSSGKAEITLKSNHPQFPLLRVPVIAETNSTAVSTKP